MKCKKCNKPQKENTDGNSKYCQGHSYLDIDPPEPLQYANLSGYSDITPYEIISRTKKTITIREMDAELDKEFKPIFIPGGFCGTVVNQSEQKYKYKSNENLETIKAYLRKDGRYHSKYGRHSLSSSPCKFYDYNF